MQTDALVSVGLRRFDGFPYMITRLVPALYHVIVLPAHLSAAQYNALFHDQCDANQLETCLALGHAAAWYRSPGGSYTGRSQPPVGGVVVTDRLQPGERFEPTPDLRARRARLARFAAAGNRGGYLLGDATHGGRAATPDDLEALAGPHMGGVPKGLERCRVCAEWRGECLDPRAPGMVVPVHCRCENHNRCAACGEIGRAHV